MKTALYTIALLAASAISYILGAQTAKPAENTTTLPPIPAKQHALENIQTGVWITRHLQNQDPKTLQKIADAMIISNLANYASTWEESNLTLTGEMTEQEQTLITTLKDVQNRSLSGKDTLDYPQLIQHLRNDHHTIDTSVKKAK